MAAEFDQIAKRHLQRLQRLERSSLSRLKPIYEESITEQQRKLRGVVKRLGGNSFSAHHHRMVLGQLRQGQAAMASKLADEMVEHTREVQAESLHALVHDVRSLEERFPEAAAPLPIEEAATMGRIIHRHKRTLLRMHHTSFAAYGEAVVGAMENQMSRSMLQEETPGEAINRLEDVAGLQWWRAERIVRTETAHAYSSAAADGIAEASKVVDGLGMMWHEFVSAGGQPLDARVGVDSLAMHGQVADPGSPFYCPEFAPNGKVVADSLAGQWFDHPPNRPNDRATLIAFHKSWGIPGWRWKGRRVPV